MRMTVHVVIERHGPTRRVAGVLAYLGRLLEEWVGLPRPAPWLLEEGQYVTPASRLAALQDLLDERPHD